MNSDTKMLIAGTEHVSIGTFPGMRERTIIVNVLSKVFSMTGWRLGYVAANQMITDALTRIHQNTAVCATTFAQWGGVEALMGSQAEPAKMVTEFKRRRDFKFDAMEKLPGVRAVKPGGSFYLFVNIEELGQPADEIAMYLLKEAGVAVVPGSAFGVHGEGCIRVSYANSYENLERGVKRMSRALDKLVNQ